MDKWSQIPITDADLEDLALWTEANTDRRHGIDNCPWCGLAHLTGRRLLNYIQTLREEKGE